MMGCLLCLGVGGLTNQTVNLVPGLQAGPVLPS